MIKGFAFKGPDVPKKSSKKKKTSTKKYPAWLKGSRINYVVNKAVAKAMNGVSENRVLPCTSFNEEAPSAIQLGALAYTKAFTIGTIPAAWGGVTGLSTLGGMTFGSGTYQGKYVYLQKTHLTMEIDMGVNNDFQVPTEFRVICFKSRRSNAPAGITYNYAESLFLDVDGRDIGHASSGVNGSDLMLQPLNRKDWDIKSDKRFMLSNPSIANASGVATNYSGKYPVSKRIVYNLPYYAKTEIADVSGVLSDLDTNYVIAIYARSLGKDSFARNWEVTTRGTTSYKDN